MSRNQRINAIEVFKAFSQQGYRKTSMTSIADAIGMSRQGLYKKHCSKEELFDWMVRAMLENGIAKVKEIVADDGKPLPERLSELFDSWVGRFIEILRSSPCAAEIMDRITSDPKKSEEISGGLIGVIEELLLKEGAAGYKVRAHEMAFTLYVASKGLALLAENRRSFNEGMRKVVNALLRE